MSLLMSQSVSLVDWLNSELTKLSSIPKEYFGAMDKAYFEATVHLGCCCLAFRHMREKASVMGASPSAWDRTIERLFPKLPVAKINLYVSAGHNLHWDMDLINKFQSLIPSEIINYNGTPVEPMADQLRRLGLVNPSLFEHWAQTNEDAKEKALREAEEAAHRAKMAVREKEEADRKEKERRARETKALHEAEVRRLEAEKAALEKQTREAQAQAAAISQAALRAEAEAKRSAEAAKEVQASEAVKKAALVHAGEAARVQAEALRAEREAKALERASQAQAEEVARAEEAAKEAETLDLKYERLLDKLIAQSQGFPKMEILFGEVATALDLLPRKKVDAFKRNMLAMARITDALFAEV